MGISKQELLEGYYIDEFLLVLDQYNKMHTYAKEDKETLIEVGPEDW